METHSQIKVEKNLKEILECQIRACYGRVVYSHKTHEKCADILLQRLSNLRLCQIILSAVVTGGLVTTFLGSGKIGASIGVAVSAILLTLNLYTKNHDLGQLAQKHKDVANKLWYIREQYLSLLTDLFLDQGQLLEIQKKRDVLLENLYAIYEASPSTTSKAYKMAQRSLKIQEDMTFSKEEIDAFLPESLRSQLDNASHTNS